LGFSGEEKKIIGLITGALIINCFIDLISGFCFVPPLSPSYTIYAFSSGLEFIVLNSIFKK